MSVLHPVLLAAGVACVALPVLIHLLMRRRQRVVRFSAMRFLIEAYQKRRRRLKLEQWLLLAARCLLVLLIALALARPSFQSGGAAAGGRAVTLVLLVDTSLASGVELEPGRTALDAHKQTARELLAELSGSDGDRAALITLGSPARALVMPPSSDPGAVASLLDRLEPEGGRADVRGAAAQVREFLDESATPAGRVRVALLSEWRAGSVDAAAALASLGDVDVLASAPGEAAVSNVAITALEPARPLVVTGAGVGTADTIGVGAQARLTLERYGPEIERAGVVTASVSVRDALEAGGRTPPVVSQAVRFRAGQRTASVTLSVPPSAFERRGEQTVLSARIDGDALAGDDQRVRFIPTRRVLRVGLVTDPGDARAGVAGFRAGEWLRLALTPGEEEIGTIDPVDLRPESLDAPRLSGLDAVVLPAPGRLDAGAWDRLGVFARSGGLVMVLPGENDPLHRWTDELARVSGLGWTAPREATDHEPPLTPDGAVGDHPALGLIRAEIEELVRSVSVRRSLAFGAGPDAPADAGAVVLALSDGSPLVLAHRPGVRGLFVVWAVAASLDWTDLPARPLFVPLMNELVRQGTGLARGQTEYVAGTPIPAAEGVASVEPVGAASGAAGVTTGETGLGTDSGGTALRRAGVWRQRDASGRTLGVLTTAPDTSASDTDTGEAERVRAWLAGLSSAGDVRWLGDTGNASGSEAERARGPQDTPLSVWLLGLAVLLAVGEAGLARWVSHARDEGVAALPTGGGAR